MSKLMFVLAALTALVIATPVSAEIGFGTTDGDLEVRGVVGNVGLAILFDGSAGKSVNGIDFTEVDLGLKLLVPIGSAVEGSGGTVQPMLWGTFLGDFTNFDTDDAGAREFDSIVDKKGQFMIGAEYRPVPALGLNAGTGVEWFVADDEKTDDTFGIAASLGFLVYFGS